MQRGSAQLVLIILILGVASATGSYLYLNLSKSKPNISPVSSAGEVRQVSGDQTHSDELNFQFDYAKDLKVIQDSEEEFNKRGSGDFRKNFRGYVGYEPGKSLGAVAVLDDTRSYETNPFSIWVFDNPNNLTVEAWFDKYWYYPFLWGVFDYTSKGHVRLDQEATISGKVAKYKTVSYQPGSPKYVYIPNDKKMYLLRVIGESGEKILSTFNFLQ